MKRVFITGSEWLYYKIYSGTKTADRILCDVIKPLSERLLEDNVIDSWFFIRYADPKQHIRIRFHLTETLLLGRTISLIHDSFLPFVDAGLVWKVATDTYNREIERYGESLIEQTEKNLFFYDSVMIVNVLKLIEGDEGEKIRWLLGLRAIDEVLESFEYNEENKLIILKKLRDAFGEEFGIDKDLKSQLSIKYRKDRIIIENILNRDNDNKSQLEVLLNLLKQKNENISPFVNDIIKRKNENILENSIDQLLCSYLHMMCSRLFKSKQRLHELVLYDFLCRYYISKSVRNIKNTQ